jgi:hypothetical protein
MYKTRHRLIIVLSEKILILMNRDSKKILFVGILITLIIGFLIIWILIEDHKSSNKTEYNKSHTVNSEQMNQDKLENYVYIDLQSLITA